MFGGDFKMADKDMNNIKGYNHISSIKVQETLKDIDYPASKVDLIVSAQENRANQMVINKLEDLPDRTYESATDLNEALSDNSDMDEEEM